MFSLQNLKSKDKTLCWWPDLVLDFFCAGDCELGVTSPSSSPLDTVLGRLLCPFCLLGPGLALEGEGSGLDLPPPSLPLTTSRPVLKRRPVGVSMSTAARGVGDT